MISIMWAVDKDFSRGAEVFSLSHWKRDVTLGLKYCEKGLSTPVEKRYQILMKQEMSKCLL